MSAPTYAHPIQGGRGYTFPDQPAITYPSVTTIIGQLEKPALRHWTGKMVAEFAFDHRESWADLPRVDAIDLMKRAPFRTTSTKADLGTLAHSLLETGTEPAADSPARPYWEAGNAWLRDEVAEVVTVEPTMRHQGKVYAGTADVICVLKDGRLAVADYKTSRTTGYIEQALQLTALAGCEQLITSDGSPVDAPEPSVGVVVQLKPDGTYATHYLNLLQPDGSWMQEASAMVHTFLGLRAVWSGRQAWGGTAGRWDRTTTGGGE